MRKIPMQKSAFLLTFCFMFAAGISPLYAAAAPVASTAPAFYTPLPLYACYRKQRTVHLCGEDVQVTIRAEEGNSFIGTSTLPLPYEPEDYTLRCFYRNNLPMFDVVTSGLRCQKMDIRCPETSETFCGLNFTIPAGTQLGDTTTVPVPEALFVPATPPHNVSFAERCELNDNKAAYHLVSPPDFSCNWLPCADADLPICGTTVHMKGGASIGQDVTLTMPAPFVADPFLVQCVGDGHEPPTYRITDAAMVSCAARPAGK